MTWQILLTISVLTYSFSTLLQKLLLRENKSNPVAFSIFFQLLTGIIIGSFAVLRGFKIPDLSPFIPNLVIMTILYGAGNVFIFKALKLIDASLFTILFTPRAVFTILAAIIFLGENFSIKQVVGTIFILIGVGIVSWKTHKLRFGMGEAFAIIASVCFGFAFANDAYVIRGFDTPSYVSLAFVIPAFFVWLVNIKATDKMKVFLGRDMFPKMITLSLVYAVSAVSYFWAYQIGRNAAQLAPLNQTSVIVTVFLAIAFLRERSNLLRKLLGAFISFSGVVLLT